LENRPQEALTEVLGALQLLQQDKTESGFAYAGEGFGDIFAPRHWASFRDFEYYTCTISTFNPEGKLKKRVSFSEQIRRAIRASGLSAYQLCQAIGLDQSTLSRFLSGRCGLSLEALDRLAEELNLEVRALPRQVRPEGAVNLRSPLLRLRFVDNVFEKLVEVPMDKPITQWEDEVRTALRRERGRPVTVSHYTKDILHHRSTDSVGLVRRRKGIPRSIYHQLGFDSPPAE
jgi:transcriptional regulator with XRE-family HTH domain